MIRFGVQGVQGSFWHQFVNRSIDDNYSEYPLSPHPLSCGLAVSQVSHALSLHVCPAQVTHDVRPGKERHLP